jgi:2-keto-4-pentenoate hydratase/2-oxohepta-3-ene-1,7-dioic acid hydratase in catechol pathway
MRYVQENSSGAKWGLVEGNRVVEITNAGSIEELHARAEDNTIRKGGSLPFEGLTPLPPTAGRVQVYCAGLNYRDHAREVRMPLPKSPIFFTKPHGSLCGACDDIVYPAGVALLDYEVELAVVVGRRIGADDEVRGDNLHRYLLGITICNDVSARDVQLSAGQWFLGKSYRTFAPLGPVVQTIDGAVYERLYGLDLELTVTDARGENPHRKGQKGKSADMVFRIHELIGALQKRTDLLPGDVIATGTPAGVALRSPGRLKSRMAEILGIAPGKRVAMFLDGEKAGNRRYLLPGDRLKLGIRSADGTVDLGEQRSTVTAGAGAGT